MADRISSAPPLKGLMLTAPGGSKYWHACKDADVGLREMQQLQDQLQFYGAAWGHAQTVIEFGTSNGDTFAVEKVVKAAEGAA